MLVKTWWTHRCGWGRQRGRVLWRRFWLWLAWGCQHHLLSFWSLSYLFISTWSPGSRMLCIPVARRFICILLPDDGEGWVGRLWPAVHPMEYAHDFYSLMQKNKLALELRLSCIKPSNYSQCNLHYMSADNSLIDLHALWKQGSYKWNAWIS